MLKLDEPPQGASCNPGVAGPATPAADLSSADPASPLAARKSPIDGISKGGEGDGGAGIKSKAKGRPRKKRDGRGGAKRATFFPTGEGKSEDLRG